MIVLKLQLNIGYLLFYAAHPVLLSTTPIYQEFSRGSDFTLSCSYNGDPLPTLQWTLNSRSVVRSVRTNIVVTNLSNGNKQSNLIISNASPEFVGRYTCIAVNTAGTSRYSFTRKLTGMHNHNPYI